METSGLGNKLGDSITTDIKNIATAKRRITEEKSQNLELDCLGLNLGPFNYYVILKIS